MHAEACERDHGIFMIHHLLGNIVQHDHMNMNIERKTLVLYLNHPRTCINLMINILVLY